MIKHKLYSGIIILTLVGYSPQVNAQQSKYWPILDKTTGQVVSEAPLPVGWKLDDNPNDDIVITGPNGIKTYEPARHEYFFTQSPGYQNQSFGQTRFAPPVSPEQYLNDIIRPNLEQRGYKFVKSYPLPEYADLKRRAIATITNARGQTSFDSIGSDWTSSNGVKTLVAIDGMYVQSEGTVFWNMAISQMDTPAHEFETAKSVLRSSAANTRINPEAGRRVGENIAAFRHKNAAYWDEVNRTAQVRHNERMRGIEAAGQTSRAFGQTSQDILDSSHNSFQRREAVRWEGQADTINTIRGETVINAPSSGQSYTVQDGSDNYWVNQNGEYIQSNDPFYNPNQDDRYGNQSWEQGQEID